MLSIHCTALGPLDKETPLGNAEGSLALSEIITKAKAIGATGIEAGCSNTAFPSGIFSISNNGEKLILAFEKASREA